MCAFIMALVMLGVVIVVTGVIIRSLNHAEPTGEICIVLKKSDYVNSTDTEHTLMSVTDLDDADTKDKCSKKLQCWGIAALSDGKLDGPCYGSEVT